MTLLDKHLEQIELCSSTIDALPFPRPRIFTNAMLHNHDITALIRDTESHERALFSLTPLDKPASSRKSTVPGDRRKTTFDASEASDEQGHFKAPGRGTAVAAVLGGELHSRINKQIRRAPQDSRGAGKTQNDELDVELLLEGAEKLCSIYAIPGAYERISALRARNSKVLQSMNKYEDLVTEQSKQLGRMNRPSSFGFADDPAADEILLDNQDQAVRAVEPVITLEDLRIEEGEIADLEQKKQVLEERVSGMQKDLGGLMR